jgi:hypothetical protein
MAKDDDGGKSRSLLDLVAGVPVSFYFTNEKGVTAKRSVIPHYWRLGTTPNHPEPEFLLVCYDLDKQDVRAFSMAEILPAPPEALPRLGYKPPVKKS